MAYTVIEINMMKGRTIATQKTLRKTLSQRIGSEKRTKALIDDIGVLTKEPAADCWGFCRMPENKARNLKDKANMWWKNV